MHKQTNTQIARMVRAYCELQKGKRLDAIKARNMMIDEWGIEIERAYFSVVLNSMSQCGLAVQDGIKDGVTQYIIN